MANLILNATAAAIASFSAPAFIGLGSGYSNDMQQMASDACFAVNQTSVSQEHGYVNLNEALSFKDIENTLRVDVTTRGGYG